MHTAPPQLPFLRVALMKWWSQNTGSGALPTFHSSVPAGSGKVVVLVFQCKQKARVSLPCWALATGLGVLAGPSVTGR